MAQSHKGEKIRSYSVAFKIGVIEWYRCEGTQNTAKMLKRSLWIEKEFVNGIKGMMFSLKPILERGKRKGNCIRVGLSSVQLWIVKFLKFFSFLDHEHGEGRVVTNRDLTQKAMEVAGSLGLEGFVASKMRLQRWKKSSSWTRRGAVTRNPSVRTMMRPTSSENSAKKSPTNKITSNWSS